MSLTREQYDEIMRGYMQKQSRRHQLTLQRRDEVYARIPEFRQLSDRVSEIAVDYLHSRLGEKRDDTIVSPAFVRPQLEEIAAKKRELLASHGFPEDYLTVSPECPFCNDTGFVNGQKCRCFRRKEVEILYSHSHLKVYQGEDLKRFRIAAAACRRMAAEFDTAYRNLYLYGTVGTGKSFLSICIAREVLESGHSVLYFSAAAMFDKLSMYSFDVRTKEELRSFTADLYECDLLIIDDLGTEFTNQFISAQLFACLNERHLNRKSTVISTNLSLAEMQSRYSDRVFSRITNDYELYKLTGSDIRVLKRRQRNAAHH